MECTIVYQKYHWECPYCGAAYDDVSTLLEAAIYPERNN